MKTQMIKMMDKLTSNFDEIKFTYVLKSSADAEDLVELEFEETKFGDITIHSGIVHITDENSPKVVGARWTQSLKLSSFFDGEKRAKLLEDSQKYTESLKEEMEKHNVDCEKYDGMDDTLSYSMLVTCENKLAMGVVKDLYDLFDNTIDALLSIYNADITFMGDNIKIHIGPQS